MAEEERKGKGSMSGAPKNTPGPWQVVPYGDGDSLVVHAGEHWRICFMATPGESPGAMDRIEANARLIAAAPELLEALRPFAHARANSGTSLTVADFDRALAALAKAEGHPHPAPRPIPNEPSHDT